jgi:hypothetical protein
VYFLGLLYLNICKRNTESASHFIVSSSNLYFVIWSGFALVDRFFSGFFYNGMQEKLNRRSGKMGKMGKDDDEDSISDSDGDESSDASIGGGSSDDDSDDFESESSESNKKKKKAPTKKAAPAKAAPAKNAKKGPAASAATAPKRESAAPTVKNSPPKAAAAAAASKRISSTSPPTSTAAGKKRAAARAADDDDLDNDDNEEMDDNDVKVRKASSTSANGASSSSNGHTNGVATKKARVEPPSSSAGVPSSSVAVTSSLSVGDEDITRGPEINTESAAKKLLIRYMKQQNRPYSALQIFDNLHKRIPKAMLERCLNTLCEAGASSAAELVCKEYNKAKIYFPNQTLMAQNVTEADMQRLIDEVAATKSRLDGVLTRERELRQQITELKAQPDDDHMDE